MNALLWVVAALLALAFAAAGALKLTQTKERLAGMGLAWTEDYSPNAIKGIGALEELGAIGLVLPPLVHIAPVLAPLAAVGLALVMVGAARTHARRKETPMIAINVVFFLLAAFVAWGRFGPYAFN